MNSCFVVYLVWYYVCCFGALFFGCDCIGFVIVLVVCGVARFVVRLWLFFYVVCRFCCCDIVCVLWRGVWRCFECGVLNNLFDCSTNLLSILGIG